MEKEKKIQASTISQPEKTENKDAVDPEGPKKQELGATLLGIQERLPKAEDNEKSTEAKDNEESTETEDDKEIIEAVNKINFLLQKANFQEPDMNEFAGEPGYNQTSIDQDTDYVNKMEKRFTNADKISKAAEAITGIAIQNGELFSYVGDIRAVVINPVTRYDDIYNGIDQAVTLITQEGEPKPFGFDVTIGNSHKTFIEKLFRPYRDSSGKESTIIGMSKLKYGQEPTLGEKGEYKSIVRKVIDPIPRLTLAFEKGEVKKMADAVELVEGDTGGEVEIDTNPTSERILHNILQIYEQVVFYARTTGINLDETKAQLKNETDPDKKAKLEKQSELLKEQSTKLKELEKTLKPALKDAYSRARRQTIPKEKRKDASADSSVRRKLMCSGLLGTTTGHLVHLVHYFEGYDEEDGSDKEADLTDAIITQTMQDKNDKYRIQHPGKAFGPSYTADDIINIEFEAMMKAKETLLRKYKDRMPDRLEEGRLEYDDIIIEKYEKLYGI